LVVSTSVMNSRMLENDALSPSNTVFVSPIGAGDGRLCVDLDQK